MVRKIKKKPPLQETQPETFIIESLNFEDEATGSFDGKVLFDTLKLHNKEPIYYYFRTAKELEALSDIFRESGYRYLHLSCHGSDSLIETTLEKINYKQFAGIFDKKLGNRRLFISGCNLGSAKLAEELFTVNGGMYSVTGPLEKVFFDQALTFWSSFYYLVNAYDSQKLKKSQLVEAFKQICPLFKVPVAHYFKNAGEAAKVVCEQYGVSGTTTCKPTC